MMIQLQMKQLIRKMVKIKKTIKFKKKIKK
jgi:hypothetical protein